MKLKVAVLMSAMALVLAACGSSASTGSGSSSSSGGTLKVGAVSDESRGAFDVLGVTGLAAIQAAVTTTTSKAGSTDTNSS